MKLKTLLLGTAAVFAVAGSAHAADLAVAESVEYVKVCDAYGAGYFYVPGSDVCLKIGAYVLMDAHWYSKSKSLNYTTDGSTDYKASWDMYMEDQISTTAKWMTDWGAATVFIAIRNHRDPDDAEGIAPGGGLGYVDTAYLKIGGLLAGWNASTFDGTMFHGLYGFESPFDHDRHQNQFQWSTTLGGIGAFLAVEDPRDNTGGSAYYTGNMPDIVAALAGSTGPFAWRWSVGVTDTNYGTGWGTELDATYSFGSTGIEGGTHITVQGAVGNDAGAGYAANWHPNGSGGTPWHVTGEFGIAWTSSFTSLLAGSYRAQGGNKEWEISGEGDFQIAKGVEAGLAVSYDKPTGASGTTEAVARVKASF